MTNLDRAFSRLGVVRHVAKDVNVQSSATCIGVDVDGGRFFGSAGKLAAETLGVNAVHCLYRCGLAYVASTTRRVFGYHTMAMPAQ